MTTTFKLDDKKLQEIIKAVGNQKTKKYIIADGVEYGVFVEFGYHAKGGGGGAGRKARRKKGKKGKRVVAKFGSHVPARPFLNPAFETVTKDLPDAIGEAVENAVNIDDVLAKAAYDVQAKAQLAVPVDTGALKNSLHVEEE